MPAELDPAKMQLLGRCQLCNKNMSLFECVLGMKKLFVRSSSVLWPWQGPSADWANHLNVHPLDETGRMEEVRTGCDHPLRPAADVYVCHTDGALHSMPCFLVQGPMVQPCMSQMKQLGVVTFSIWTVP
jgi:hypothetical protein